MRMAVGGALALLLATGTLAPAQTPTGPVRPMSQVAPPPPSPAGDAVPMRMLPAPGSTPGLPVPPDRASWVDVSPVSGPEALLHGDLNPVPTHPASAYPYLMWAETALFPAWVKGSRVPPLVTTGPATAAAPGSLGDPRTSVLFASQQADYGTLFGARWLIGTWCDLHEHCGIDLAGFATDRGSSAYQAGPSLPSVPVLSRPVINALTGTETAVPVSLPGIESGAVGVHLDTQIWGMESNFWTNCYRAEVPLGDHEFPYGGLRVDLAVGLRYLDLTESLTIDTNSRPVNGTTVPFGGGVAGPGSLVTVGDAFRSQNYFFGGQLAARAEYWYGCWAVNLTGKLALGRAHGRLDVEGDSVLNGPVGAAGSPPTVVLPGGLLATSTNIGRTGHNRFAAVPDLAVSVAYQMYSCLRLSVGYRFLYWEDVVRAADQVDRTVNFTQAPTSPAFGPLTGPFLPARLFRQTDFWIQSIEFGAEFRF